MTQQTKFFAITGGLDLVTAAIAMPPGLAAAALNYEPLSNGYRRCDGFERYDGRTRPSEATWYQINFDAGTAAISAGNTVTGATSGATGVALATATVSSGSYGAGTAAGYIGLGAVTGTFQDNENLQVGGVTKCVANGTAELEGSPNDATAETWASTAATNARALIAKPTGSGSIRGVWAYNGKKYCFRNNAGGTAVDMWQSSTSGWTQITFGREVAFTSGGTTEIVEGNTITGATSGATAVVRRVAVTSGTWAAGTAAGWFTLSGQSGTFQAENLNVGAAPNLATIAGNSSAITLPAGGRYEFVNYNFYGTSSQLRMYGCNGVGPAFEFDGTYLVPIHSGAASDTPHRIGVHRNALLLALPGGSNLLSTVGSPHVFTGALGAADIAIGDEITDYVPASSGATIILAKNSINVLYGNDDSDYTIDKISDEAGALPWTADKVGQALYMDNRGIRTISSTQAYGNFNVGTMTQLISPLLIAYKRAGVEPVASCRVRAKDQYRIFFDNEDVLCIYLGKKQPEILPLNYERLVTCICSVETDDGEEIYFGSDDGYVYQLDKGNSFDGDEIASYLRLAFNHMGSPQVQKRWHKAVLELDGSPESSIYVSADFDYGLPYDLGIPSVTVSPELFTVTAGGGIWDVSNWNEFYWSSQIEGTAEAFLDGVGKNMSLLITSESATDPPHLLKGVTLFYTMRGLRR